MEKPKVDQDSGIEFKLTKNASGGHRMAYWEWGDPASPHLVVCVHGLSRQGRDFDVLARHTGLRIHSA